MYQIIGGDGKEYGPVSAEQVRDWIAQGRASAQTRARAADTSDWRMLGEFPEFAAAFGPKAADSGAPPLPPPSSGPVTINIDALAKEVLARNPRVEIGACFSRSWALLTQRFWLAVGVCFVGSLVENVPLIFGVMHAGMFWFFLKRIRGEDAKFEDAFSAFSVAFLPAFLGGIVVSLLGVLGLAFCVIPGLILITIWTFTWPLLMDKRLDFWPAMELSRKVLWPNFWGMFGLWAVSVLAIIAGMICCYVGVFVALPVVLGAQAYAYEDFFGKPRQAAT